MSAGQVQTATVTRSRAPASSRIKRALDVAGAALLLLVLALPMAVVAILIRVTMGPPVIFSQERPGLGGQLFRLHKFRTMRDVVDERGRPIPDPARVTRLGLVLRSTSLDELPELVNVLRGEMSLVGPRPLLASYMHHYDAAQSRRHEVRPGITGLAQVEGRKGLTWEETFALDVRYIDEWTPWLDLRLLLRTCLGLITRAGRTGRQDFTRPDFMGSGTTVRPPATVRPLQEACVPVLTTAELAEWAMGQGRAVIPRHGTYWERTRCGFHQPLHLLERLDPEQARRPATTTLAFRAALAPTGIEHATGSIPARLLTDVCGYDETSLARKPRNRLRHCRRTVEIGVIDDPDVLMREGHDLAVSAGQRIGFAVPDRATYRRRLQAYLAGDHAVVMGGVMDGRLVGYMTTFVVGRTAYMDLMHVCTSALPSSVVLGLVFDYVQLLRLAADVDEVMYGIDRRENPTLGRFKDAMGFPVVPVPARVWMSPGVEPLLRRMHPNQLHRLTGRT